MSDEISYCAGEARRHDRDRFLCALFAPRDRREAIYALLAFNIELARVREATREPLAGRLRLQWWRDTLAILFDGPGGGAGGHPVLEPLARAIGRYGLSRTHFDDLIDARDADLDAPPPADIAALTAFAEQTSAPLVLLILEVLGGGGAPPGAVVDAGRNAGIAWALTGLIRATGFDAGRGRLYLPGTILRDRSADPADVLGRRFTPALAAAVGDIADLAREHLARARRARPDVAWEFRPGLLLCVLAENYLRRIERHGHNPFDGAIEGGRAGRQVRLALMAWRGAY